MTGGFGTVPDELHQAAGKIGDVISNVAGMVWEGPSGDYGHPGVQTGWAQFVDEMKTQVQGLHDKANEHGKGLRSAAALYQDSDGDVGKAVGKLGGLFDDGGGLTGAPGGGTTGSITSILDGAKEGSGLHDVPGGGFTGGLTPTELNDRLGLGPKGGEDLGGEAKIGAGLHDVPGGGFTGNLTPSELNDRFEEAGGSGDAGQPES